MEMNRSGIFFLLQKNNAFCSSAYAMTCSSLQVESFLLSKKDNWTFNESCRWRYSASNFCVSGEVLSPYSIISLYCLISGICSGCTLLFSKSSPAYSFNKCCFVAFLGFSTEQNVYLNINCILFFCTDSCSKKKEFSRILFS